MRANLQLPKQRIHSIDILRGIIMIIMALDHVRDFFHVNAMTDDPTNLATTTPVLFFTRWITHFCAPIFIFLSGMSASIIASRKTKRELSSFLIKRGIWLILFDFFIMSLILTFNPFFNVIFLLVFWSIGFSMIMLGLFSKTSLTTIIVIGCLLVFGHNIFDFVHLKEGSIAATIINLFLNGKNSVIPLGSNRIIIIGYTPLPWTGAMFLGYAMGKIYTADVPSVKRKRILLFAGIAATALFILLRFINLYGDPSYWSVQKNGMFTLLSFLNTTKYPPSLLFFCMTLGPALIALSLFDSIRNLNPATSILVTYGRVPFFYFVIHFLLTHTLCVVVFFASGYSAKNIIDPAAPMLFRPQHFGFSLWVVYVIWLSVVATMYLPCKWFGKYKTTRKHAWLSYV